MKPTETSVALRQAGLIAIFRGAFTREQLLELADALVAGGVTALELTLNSADALSHLPRLKRHLGSRALVGAGTVRAASEVDAALDAGAAFLIAPTFDPASVTRAHARGALLLPGVFTASEAQAAWAAGCPLVKLFPADALGPSYLKALRAPLDDIGFVPTGGIQVDNLSAYVGAGAVAFGVGSALVAGPEQSPDDLSVRARRFTLALRQARKTSA